MEIIVNSCIIGNSFVANWPIVVWWKRLRFVRPVIQFDTSSTTLLNVMMFVFLDWNWRIRYPVEQSVRWYWYGGSKEKRLSWTRHTFFSETSDRFQLVRICFVKTHFFCSSGATMSLLLSCIRRRSDVNFMFLYFFSLLHFKTHKTRIISAPL